VSFSSVHTAPALESPLNVVVVFSPQPPADTTSFYRRITSMNDEPRGDTSRGSVSSVCIAWGILLLSIAVVCDTVTISTGRYFIPLVVAIVAASLATGLIGINFIRSGLLLRCILALLVLTSFGVLADAGYRLVWLWSMGKV
jgi:hypothetical protein